MTFLGYSILWCLLIGYILSWKDENVLIYKNAFGERKRLIGYKITNGYNAYIKTSECE